MYTCGCLYLSLTFYKFRKFAKIVFTFFLYVYVTLMGNFYPRKSQEKTTTSGLIIVCSRLGRIGNSFNIGKMAGYVKHLKVENFLHSQPSLAHGNWDIIWLTSFKSCTRPWFLVAFLKNLTLQVFTESFSFLPIFVFE